MTTNNHYDSLYNNVHEDERQQDYNPYQYSQNPYQYSQNPYQYSQAYMQPQMQMYSPYYQQQPPQQLMHQPMQQTGFGLQTPTFALQTPGTTSLPIPGMLPLEESYIENILRLNKGKIATVYMTFENNREWNAKIFRGAIEAAGRDHLILSDPQTGTRYLLPMIYLDYVTFDEEINYEYPYAGAGVGLSSYSPR